MGTAFERAIVIFRQHNGFLRSSEALKLGIHPQTLSRMTKAGVLVREERGLYRLGESTYSTDPDLLHVAKLIPKAVICLVSALSFHNLTSQLPRRVYIALPQKIKKPKFNYPLLDVVWLSESSYSSGIEFHQMDGVKLAVYSREKTIADCFKFRNKIGEDVAKEALQDYLRISNRNIDLLLHYADIDRVREKIEPYIKALV